VRGHVRAFFDATCRVDKSGDTSPHSRFSAVASHTRSPRQFSTPRLRENLNRARFTL
jgi:hypothetical protein